MMSLFLINDLAKRSKGVVVIVAIGVLIVAINTARSHTLVNQMCVGIMIPLFQSIRQDLRRSSIF
jgi:hypothetical protein